MSSKDSHLYGIPRPKKTPSSRSKPINGADSLTFSTALSSLISASKPRTTSTSITNLHPHTAPTTTTTTSARARPSKSEKPSIFSTHNRNSAKRAAADMLARDADAHRNAAGTGRVDEESWRRAKRKMEEKARLYGRLKRGEEEDAGERHMVDFDRKWAEDGGDEAEEEEEEEDGEEEEEEKVEFVDEFGRTRVGTRGEAAREERRRAGGVGGAVEEDSVTARPAAPRNLIFGDTIQAAAFNPDEDVTAQMAQMARERDREPTPPEDVHYDADWEIRSKGTGFFKFAKSEEERREQMEALEKERKETERVRGEEEETRRVDERLRAEREGEREQVRRKKEVEERRRMIRAKRDKMKADRFLEELGGEMWVRADEAERDDEGR